MEKARLVAKRYRNISALKVFFEKKNKILFFLRLNSSDIINCKSNN